ncbi:MAG: sugar transferase [Bryobacterales bacterium]|jgi:lipopolysaccharide/colanic/teichoic acid biosynthesis glycosyltransferase|nr:sugar transferase [Bryobacterales bacterium]
MLDCVLSTPLRSRPRHSHQRVFRIGDMIVVAASFTAAQLLVSRDEFWLSLQVDPWGSLGSLVLVFACVTVCLEVGDPQQWDSVMDRLRQISLALGVGFLIESFLAYSRFTALSPEVMLVGSALCALLLTSWYWIFGIAVPASRAPLKVLLLDADPVFEAVVPSPVFRGRRCEMLGPLKDPNTLGSVIHEHHLDYIVVQEANRELPTALLLELRSAGVAIESAAEFYESALERVSTRHLHPRRFLFGELTPKRQNLAIQAIYSNVVVLIVLTVALPLLLLIMLALKVSAPSQPVFQKQRCAGLNNVPFTLLRFQSRSWLGRWLKRFGLDGLPQLLNVVRGEMSLVGPRPQRLEFAKELAQHIPYYGERLTVRPGLTGWAQIHAPDADALLELEYDLYYTANLSPGFDLRIIIGSLRANR